MAKKKSNKNKTQTQRQERPIKICTICEQPHRTRTQLCAICNKKSKELGQRLPYVKGKASISKLLWLKKKYRTNDIFKLLNSNPSLYWDGSNKKERNFYKGLLKGTQIFYGNFMLWTLRLIIKKSIIRKKIT